MSAQRCQNGWSVRVIEGVHKVATEHECTGAAGHAGACRCVCGMPDPAALVPMPDRGDGDRP